MVEDVRSGQVRSVISHLSLREERASSVGGSRLIAFAAFAVAVVRDEEMRKMEMTRFESTGLSSINRTIR